LIDFHRRINYYFTIYSIYNTNFRKKILDSLYKNFYTPKISSSIQNSKKKSFQISKNKLSNPIDKLEISNDSFCLYLEEKLWEHCEKKNDSFIKKDDFLEILYSYNFSPDMVLENDEKCFREIFNIYKKKHSIRVISQVPSKMKREEISFVPVLNKTSKIKLFLSIIFWISIYILLIYFKILESIDE